jgi:hypothetical protein
MISYEESTTLEGPFANPESLDTIVEFYRLNGYEIRDGDENSDGAIRHVVLERGATSKGWWWSSNTARLRSKVEATLRDGAIRLRYEVDRPGQPLTKHDRKFWRREMRAAVNLARNPNRRPGDLRHEAAVRAEHLRRRLLSYGIWGVLYLLGFVVVVRMFATGGGT